MALWICEGCRTRYSVGAPRCPQCGGTDHAEDGEMPKIHANRPDSHEPVQVAEPPQADPEVVELEPAEQVERPSPRRRDRGPRRPRTR